MECKVHFSALNCTAGQNLKLNFLYYLKSMKFTQNFKAIQCIYYGLIICVCFCDHPILLQVGSNSSVDYCQLQFDYCDGVRVNNSGHYPYRECNKVSTGVSVILNTTINSYHTYACIYTQVILLADNLPTLVAKLTAPWFMSSIPYWSV